MPDEKEKKDYYYKTIVVQHIEPDRGAALFDQLCNEFAVMHDVECATSGFAYANTRYVYTMTFCCKKPAM